MRSKALVKNALVVAAVAIMTLSLAVSARPPVVNETANKPNQVIEVNEDGYKPPSDGSDEQYRAGFFGGFFFQANK
ncbi:hypothetical protein H4219_003063 [Mycoemilia scoparia]|uniref:Uncharacterized protein n=1 Tax=Mycoemilia scoparia TaxID=417184 RepID=A0A9W7ZVW7_9FUNG|nr:hypothetical protein H4219_003063 [Mycoemilia scoparia]